MRFTSLEIAQITAGHHHQDASFDRTFIDTRKPIPGGLFVALKGPHFDGHDYVAQAAQLGARGALVSRPISGLPSDFALITVPDTTRALSDLAIAARRRHPGRFIALTGSVGKTTTKDMAALALSPFGKVGKTPGNYNNHLGLPLTLLNLDGDEAFVLLELGMSHPGEITRLSLIAAPELALITQISLAHLENFADIDAIARAKGELFQQLSPHALALVNRDDPHIAALPHTAKGAFFYGRAPQNDLRLTNLQLNQGQLRADLHSPQGPFQLQLPSHAPHHADNALAALAIPATFGLDLGRATHALNQGFQPAEHRLQRHLFGRLTILDDAYNASPASMRAALHAFDIMSQHAPSEDRLFVLGTMRELGPQAPTLHREIALEAQQLGGTIFGCGEHGATLSDQHAPTVDALLPEVLAWAKAHPEGFILLKGSRGEALDRLIAPLHALYPHTEEAP